MQLIRGLYNIRPEQRGCVATIGNFDGVHLGHQVILRQVAAKAAELRLPTVAITFEPLPAEFFVGEEAPARLSRLREKVALLQAQEIDYLLCLRFDPALARMRSGEFVEQVLVSGIDVRYLVIGDDFRFGADREGSFATLREAGRRAGFEVVNTDTLELGGARVSSTRIREALQAGDMREAERLLGRPYSITGHVVHGDKIGRTIGFPTANVLLNRHKSPVRGVFAVQVHGLADTALPGVANVGNRPMLENDTFLLEVYVFDFDEDIYGRHIRVDLLHRLRGEEYFESFELLRQQMVRDAEAARACLAS